MSANGYVHEDLITFDPAHLIAALIAKFDPDAEREGLADTPTRWLAAMAELTEGNLTDPAAVLGTTFEVGYDAMVVVKDIPFASLCEHHLLPFHGHISIGYIPQGRVLGLSKLARLVEVFARRFQIQERLTVQIATTIESVAVPLGVGVVCRAFHTCMALRGVRKEAEMVTSSMLGALLDEPETRAEFMALVR
jgi:GTP cyclohydrolase I